MKKVIFILSLGVLLSCTSGEQTSENAQESTVPKLSLAWQSDTINLITPESVIYDAARNQYLVSCINGVPPTAKDGDGYIAILNEDGTLSKESGIGGMDAPKGMAIIGDFLYVTDITRIHKIDIANAVIVKTIDVEGTEFLNDITLDEDTNILYISDSNTSTIYKLENDEVELLVQNDAFGGSNGLLFQEGELLVAGFGTGAFHKLSLENMEVTALADSLFGGDGVVNTPKGTLVSNWNGQISHLDQETGETTLLLDTIEEKRNAADIFYHAEKNLVLVPEFFGNRVSAYTLD